MHTHTPAQTHTTHTHTHIDLQSGEIKIHATLQSAVKKNTFTLHSEVKTHITLQSAVKTCYITVSKNKTKNSQSATKTHLTLQFGEEKKTKKLTIAVCSKTHHIIVCSENTCPITICCKMSNKDTYHITVCIKTGVTLACSKTSNKQ